MPLLAFAAVSPGVAEGEGATASGAVGVALDTSAAARPFGPGERADYQVRLGGVGVGRGSMEVTGIQQVAGHATYHVRLQLRGGIPLARVDDTFESWIDVEGLFSRRFKQDQKEIRFERRRTFDFFPESRTYRQDNGEVGSIPTDRPLDDVSFLYYARTLPLQVGDTYTIPRYFREDGNPVVLEVLRRETIRVPAGTFETIVVRPIIRTRGLFSQGGEAEVYLSDDDQRFIVQIRSRVPVIGSMTMSLTEFQAGEPSTRGRAR